MKNSDVMIIGIGCIGQQIAKTLCELQIEKSININRIYLCGRNLKKINAIREDLLSSLLLYCHRKGFTQENYKLLESSLIACDLNHNFSADIFVLSFGVPLDNLSIAKAQNEDGRAKLFTPHTQIFESLVHCVRGKNDSPPWILNIVNPIEQMCEHIRKYAQQNAHICAEKIVGCSAELDAIRGLKYYMRENNLPLDEYKIFYHGEHDEKGNFYLKFKNTNHLQLAGEGIWKTFAAKEGRELLYQKNSPPVFGPSESVISTISALCSDIPTQLSCSVWAPQTQKYFSNRVKVSRNKITIFEQNCSELLE